MHSLEVAGDVLILDLPCHLHLDRPNTTLSSIKSLQSGHSIMSRVKTNPHIHMAFPDPCRVAIYIVGLDSDTVGDSNA
jgi:hypothetical protein